MCFGFSFGTLSLTMELLIHASVENGHHHLCMYQVRRRYPGKVRRYLGATSCFVNIILLVLLLDKPRSMFFRIPSSLDHHLGQLYGLFMHLTYPMYKWKIASSIFFTTIMEYGSPNPVLVIHHVHVFLARIYYNRHFMLILCLYHFFRFFTSKNGSRAEFWNSNDSTTGFLSYLEILGNLVKQKSRHVSFFLPHRLRFF